MKAFTILESTAVPLDLPNVDTDQIIPKQFLKRVERTGFGEFLFWDWRYDNNKKEIADFSLNKPEHKGGKILLARDNFGCGSSREHAPWALNDFGFWAIIAPSYADIFFNNCFQNGMLPIILPSQQVDILFRVVNEDPATKFRIDLQNQVITFSHNGEQKISFEIDQDKKYKLLNGLDDIGLTLQKADFITKYEGSRAFY